MQKYFGILLMAIIGLSSCGEKANQANQAAVMTKNIPVAKRSKAKKKVSGAININVTDAKAKSGEEVCVSFIVSNFNNILGFQHSIQFDPAELEFIGSKNFGLPHLADSNFGATKANEGTLNFLWFDMNVKGVSVDNESRLYDLCFKTLAKKGSQCEISVTGTPTKMEVVGPEKTKMNLITESGKITVE